MKKLIGLLCLTILLSGCAKSNIGGGFYNPQNNNVQTVSSTPVGANGNVQFATNGLFNSSNNLNWDNTNSALNITGQLNINTTTPGMVATVATSTLNATTSVVFGKVGTKGFCATWYSVSGTAYRVQLEGATPALTFTLGNCP